MRNYKLLLIPLVILGTVSCRSVITSHRSESIAKPNEAAHKLMAVLWFQNSAEAKAAYYQTYYFAKKALKENVESCTSERPKAVVVDIDETLLDNSPYEVKQIETGKTYTSQSWKEWTDKASAKALPGAVDFLNYADAMGVDIFYVSNRKLNETEATLKNLITEGFPQCEAERLLLKSDTSSKIARRKKISETHEIILLVGDALGDFSGTFDDRTSADKGLGIVDQNAGQFGTKYIIFPNPMYGGWEKILFQNKTNLDFETKDRLRKAALHSF